MRVLLVLSLVLLAQDDVAKHLAVVQDVKAPLADRETAVKTLAKSKPGGLALLDLAAR